LKTLEVLNFILTLESGTISSVACLILSKSGENVLKVSKKPKNYNLLSLVSMNIYYTIT